MTNRTCSIILGVELLASVLASFLAPTLVIWTLILILFTWPVLTGSVKDGSPHITVLVILATAFLVAVMFVSVLADANVKLSALIPLFLIADITAIGHILTWTLICRTLYQGPTWFFLIVATVMEFCLIGFVTISTVALVVLIAILGPQLTNILMVGSFIAMIGYILIDGLRRDRRRRSARIEETDHAKDS